ncbi:MAG: zinc metalloprotease [Sphingomonas sanxanigenens]|uniref:Zinc metalloprotease n=1 Tax=Sphingomonas sanxanigenens TaxID=397260 RepID=A0A2W5C2F5_9SPHN|nr:MAG: zinc metalloprotease [Sphingomonas sanxanigenens]
MRLDDYRTSDNIEDQRGTGGGGGLGFGGGGIGGGGLGLILGLVGSKFGIVGIIVVIAGAFLLGINPFGGGTVSGPAPQAVTNGKTAAQSCAIDAASRFSCQVMASTEDTWSKIFAQHGERFTPAKLVFYSQNGSSGCGAAQSAMGPFYCPTDNRIYLDTDFFNELQNRFHAAGDFAQAYVIAHEMGHHIQTITGISDKVRAAQSRGSEAQANQLQVRMELQADCYAGVWAAQNRDRLDPGDVQEGMTAANAIGDDTLQKAAGQRPVPESFTHGTSAQRMEWLKRGIDSGDPAQCDTFKGVL